MRLFIGLVLAAIFLFAGLATMVGAADMLFARGGGEQAWVGLGFGAVLAGLGVAIAWLSLKAAAKRRQAKAQGKRPEVDRGAVEGTLLGIGMATLGDDNLGGDD